MMYKNNFVAVIKSGGKILREKNGCVMLPFGTEYSILLKNLNSRRAVARVSVDGEDVLDCNRVIVPENGTVEIKGKMKGNKVRHQFKFINKTKEISNYRGDRPDDGLVRVEYWLEEEYIQCLPAITFTTYTDNSKHRWTDCGPDIVYGSSTGGMLGNETCSYNCSSVISPPGNDGITVQGSNTKQDFTRGYTRALEINSSVIVLQLRGYSKKGKVVRPVTVKTRFRCSTCGRKSKSAVKWCSNCGTNLEM